MVQIAYLSRKRRFAGPSGAANPAVRRYPTRPCEPVAPSSSGEGLADLPLPMLLAIATRGAMLHAC